MKKLPEVDPTKVKQGNEGIKFKSKIMTTDFGQIVLAILIVSAFGLLCLACAQ